MPLQQLLNHLATHTQSEGIMQGQIAIPLVTLTLLGATMHDRIAIPLVIHTQSEGIIQQLATLILLEATIQQQILTLLITHILLALTNLLRDLLVTLIQLERLAHLQIVPTLLVTHIL